MNEPVSGLVSPMLRLFRAGTVPYQPEVDELALETGDPQVSLENLQRLMGAGLGIVDFLVRPTGVLAVFLGGEQYYAPGLRVGTKGLATKALAHIAAEAGFGPEEYLLDTYRTLPETYTGQLVSLNQKVLIHPNP
jgi:hypothetical protein